MRSEKEIRDRINLLSKLEKREAKEIESMIKENENDFLDVWIEKANALQAERITLEWVLGDNLLVTK